jgi:uncharacterized membrane protein
MESSSRIVRFVGNRPRIFIAVVLGFIAYFIEPWQLRPIQRPLLAWDIGMWLYLAMIWTLMARASPADVQRVAEREDEGATVVAIVLELSAAKGISTRQASINYALTGATMIGAWLLIPTMFTLQYARYYHKSGESEASLKFPDQNQSLDYWDFLYFSFTIAVASQTSDVSLCSGRARRTALAQSVLSFFFNAAVLGLSVNIAAGLLGS